MKHLRFTFSLTAVPFFALLLCMLSFSPVAAQYTYDGMSKKDYFEHQWMQIGDKELNRGNYQGALSSYRKVLEYKPNSSRAYAAMGKVYSQLDQHQEAISAYQQAANFADRKKHLVDYYLAYSGLGVVYLKLNDDAKAKEAFQVVTQYKPTNQAEARMVENARALIKNIDDVRALDQAWKDYSKAGRDPQQDAPGTKANGEIGKKKNEIDELELMMLSNCVRTSELAEQNKSGQSLAQSRQKCWDKLIAVSKKSLTIEWLRSDATYMSNVNFRLGYAYTALGQHQDAATAYKESIRYAPANAGAHANLAWTYAQLGDWKASEKEYREAVKLDPNNTSVHFGLEGVLAYQHKDAEAEAELKEILRLDPTNAEALNDLGYRMVERGERLNEALPMIERAVKANPQNGSYLDSLGWAYFKTNQLEKAEEYMTKAVQYETTNAIIYEHLGDVYKARGKTEEARKAWEKAQSLTQDEKAKARLSNKAAH